MTTLVLLLSNILFPLAALGYLFYFALSPRRGLLKNLPEELRERSGRLSSEALGKLSGRRVIWVHAASAGEVSAASPLLKRLRARALAPAVILTCSTAAGRDKARAQGLAEVVALAPLDFFAFVGRFLDSARPRALLIVETELWPNMIALSRRRGVKVCMVNGRLSAESFARYRWFAPFIRPFLWRFARLCVQSEGDAQRFLSLGAPPERVVVTGNMKYDEAAPPAPRPEVAGRIRELGWDKALIWVAGSTHPVEETLLADAFLQAQRRFANLKLMVAPRHVERAGQAARSLAEKGLSIGLWSEPARPCDCLLVDALGLLPELYSLARVSFVGGTLVPVGGHNLLEPALAGSPVVFGPHTHHTAQTAALLASSGSGFCAADSAELAGIVMDMLGDLERAKALGQKARQTALSLQGATERTLSKLGDILEPVAR